MSAQPQKPVAIRKTTSEALVEEIRQHADDINSHPFGRVQIDWQDGRLVSTEVTKKFRPTA